MKTILFDENASETNNNFHQGSNLTIRRGTKYLKELDIGDEIILQNLKGQLLGKGVVTQMIAGKLQDIPLEILVHEHDTKCRMYVGLVEVLQNCYDDKTIDFNEVVTGIMFNMRMEWEGV